MDGMSTPEAQLDLGVVAELDDLGERLQLPAAPALNSIARIDSGCLKCHVVAPIDSSAPVWSAKMPTVSTSGREPQVEGVQCLGRLRKVC
jgi:hypothetical protein